MFYTKDFYAYLEAKHEMDEKIPENLDDALAEFKYSFNELNGNLTVDDLLDDFYDEDNFDDF